MYARTIEQTAARLSQLRREGWADEALAALALGLAVGATQVRPAFALPLLAGGIAVAVLGVRALWRRYELLYRLALERDAYAIPEVRAYAARSATMGNRRMLAASIRGMLKEPGLMVAVRIAAAAEDLEALASELERDELELDPAGAVACVRLLTDGATSPLLNSAVPAADLHSRLWQIRAGFGQRLAA